MQNCLLTLWLTKSGAFTQLKSKILNIIPHPSFKRIALMPTLTPQWSRKFRNFSAVARSGKEFKTVTKLYLKSSFRKLSLCKRPMFQIQGPQHACQFHNTATSLPTPRPSLNLHNFYVVAWTLGRLKTLGVGTHHVLSM